MIRSTLLYVCNTVLLLSGVYSYTDHRHYDPRLITEEELQLLIDESKQPDLLLQDDEEEYEQEEQNHQDNSYENDDPYRKPKPSNKKKPKVKSRKAFTVMIYIAADNDLHYFAWKNIKQMEVVGSNQNINIVVQLNTPGHLNPTKRYLIKKGKRLLAEQQYSLTQKINSGSPFSLISFSEWAVKNYPADNYALIVWNHGTGAVDPGYAKTINPCELFYCNPANNMLELDRGLTYLNLIIQRLKEEPHQHPKRGMCFDESFKSYITNKDFEFALREIYTKVLKNKKLALIAFDACLMSMIEIASSAKHYAEYMIASQEVEFGTGYNYEYVFKPFETGTMTPKEFATHIVNMYEKTYQNITNEYTHAALDLTMCKAVEQNINTVSSQLLELIAQSNYAQATNILRKCKSTQYCTCFDEPSYIDLGHFYTNLQNHLQYFTVPDQTLKAKLTNQLSLSLTEGLALIKSCVIANKTGSKLKKAQGISIYFPERSVIKSYQSLSFSSSNAWKRLLNKYTVG